MSLIARLTYRIAHRFVFLAALLACSAWTSTARAGFELALDGNSVEQLGENRYAINVMLDPHNDTPDDSSDDVTINGIVATFKSNRDGLVFLSVGPATGGLFDGDQSYGPGAADNSPSEGYADEPWTAWIFMNNGTVTPTSLAPAFRLEFAVKAPGPYTIDYVNEGLPLSTQYSYQGDEGFPLADFAKLTPVTVLASTPEPGSCALLMTAMGGMGLWRWRRGKSSAAGL